MSKLGIQNEYNETIVGILEEKPELDIDRSRPRIVLIVHGILGSHLNKQISVIHCTKGCWIGHKDYLFQRLLAEKLPYSSFRFDFRGNGESGGSPGYCNILVQFKNKQNRYKKKSALWRQQIVL